LSREKFNNNLCCRFGFQFFFLVRLFFTSAGRIAYMPHYTHTYNNNNNNNNIYNTFVYVSCTRFVLRARHRISRPESPIYDAGRRVGEEVRRYFVVNLKEEEEEMKKKNRKKLFFLRPRSIHQTHICVKHLDIKVLSLWEFFLVKQFICK